MIRKEVWQSGVGAHGRAPLLLPSSMPAPVGSGGGGLRAGPTG